MITEAIQYLESNRKIVIELDTNKLVDTTIEHIYLLRDVVKQEFNKELNSPEVHFNRNYLEYLQMDLTWNKDEHYLETEIFEGRTNIYIYYTNEVTKEHLSFSYTLDEPLPDELLNKLLLFTE